MSNNELQVRFQSISSELERLNIQKAKAEANLETLAIEKETLKNQVLTLAKAETLEEAETKLSMLKQKLESLSAEAEAILNASV